MKRELVVLHGSCRIVIFDNGERYTHQRYRYCWKGKNWMYSVDTNIRIRDSKLEDMANQLDLMCNDEQPEILVMKLAQ